MISKEVAKCFESCKGDIYRIEKQIENDEVQFELVGIGRLTRQGLQNLYQCQIHSNEVSNLIPRVNLIQDVADSVVIDFQLLTNNLLKDSRLETEIFMFESNQLNEKEIIKDFITRLTKAIAILGANRVVKLLDGWLNGARLNFTQYFYIHGITVTKTEKVSDTIEIQPFTKFQRNIMDSYGLEKSPSGALCAVLRFESNPIFKLIADRVSNFGDEDPIEIVYDIFALCDVLSLETGHHISVISSWCDSGELEAFGHNLITERMTFNDAGIFSGIEKLPNCMKLSPNEVQLAVRLQRNINKFNNNQESLKIAISRWRESMRFTVGFWDQAINLRIALEALYLSDIQSSGEFSFRLSSRCAWHLGENASEREKIFFQCRKFYGLASKAVHGNNIGIRDSEVAIVAKARIICRLGILKTIIDNKVYEWNKIVVGAS